MDKSWARTKPTTYLIVCVETRIPFRNRIGINFSMNLSVRFAKHKPEYRNLKLRSAKEAKAVCSMFGTATVTVKWASGSLKKVSSLFLTEGSRKKSSLGTSVCTKNLYVSRILRSPVNQVIFACLSRCSNPTWWLILILFVKSLVNLSVTRA